MEQVLKLLEQLPDDSHVLTVRLFQTIQECYRTPKLRRRLVEIPVKKFQQPLPGANDKELTYLLAGLMAISGFEVDPFPPVAFIQQLGQYLRAGARCGISISQFLAGSLTPWNEIRPNYRELIRTQLSHELQAYFPKLKEDSSLRTAEYLLSNNLVRVVPAFPFHQQQTDPPVMMFRPQADLPWVLVSEPQDACDTLCSHFPDIDWRTGSALTHKICFVGVRLLSPLSGEASLVLKKSLSKLDYQATTRVKDKEKLLSLTFLTESDSNLFQFNLRHYAKFSSIHYQFTPVQLSEYRKGYPGWSGFFEPDVIQQAGL
jgi:hypothetical protein